MQRLIPLCIWSGVSIAYYSGYMVTLIGEKSGTHYAESYKVSMKAMMGLGFG